MKASTKYALYFGLFIFVFSVVTEPLSLWLINNFEAGANLVVPLPVMVALSAVVAIIGSGLLYVSLDRELTSKRSTK